MQERFEQLADHTLSRLRAGEDATVLLRAEQSSFVRFNHGRVRQPGDVTQGHLHVRLIRGARHASVELSVGAEDDEARIDAAVASLRDLIAQVPDDPHLLWSERSERTEHVQPGAPPDPHDLADDVLRLGEGLDLVGILATGTLQSGFASSRGQRDWDHRHSTLLDWSLVHAGDKAVKSTLGGPHWDADALERRMASARAQLDALARPVQPVAPGKHRVWLSPAAVGELVGLLCRDGFGLRAHRTHVTSMLRLARDEATLHPDVHLTEDVAGGLGPPFTHDGFHATPRVELVRAGRLGDLLVSPRSSREYGVPTTGAGDLEQPSSLAMAAGDLADDQVLEQLGTGLYVTNLWYLNWSDRNAARVTGMTRFATLWIEDGQVAGPAEVMRFDDTLYHLLGEGLQGIGDTAELIPSARTYGRRSTSSKRLPGLLVDQMLFTL